MGTNSCSGELDLYMHIIFSNEKPVYEIVSLRTTSVFLHVLRFFFLVLYIHGTISVIG